MSELTATATIRPARNDELPLLNAIEREAGRRFLQSPHPEIAFGKPLPRRRLSTFLAAGHLWVAVDENDHPIGFAALDDMGDALHLEEISVRLNQQGRGVGSRLINHVIHLARREGYARLTLSTFRDVPWNQPYYERRGFTPIPDHRLPARLRRLRMREAGVGIPVENRVCMEIVL